MVIVGTCSNTNSCKMTMPSITFTNNLNKREEMGEFKKPQ